MFCFQAEDGIRALIVTGVQTCALPIYIGNESQKSGIDEAELNEFYKICINELELDIDRKSVV